MYLVIRGIRNTLADMADLHFRELNLKANGRDYLKYSPANLISEIINSLPPEDPKNRFFSRWSENDYRFLKCIITAEPRDFPSLIVQVNDFLTICSLTLNDIETELKTIFNYGNWRRSSKCVKLFNELGLMICPYCNCEEVYLAGDQIYVDFDHFYSQTDYPYLSLSFNNLIPSCHNCNSNSKGIKPFCVDTHLHPYIDNYHHHAKFKTHPGVLKYNDKFDVKIDPTTVGNTRMINYTMDFNLVNRYNRRLVLDRALRHKVSVDAYPESRIDEIIQSPLYSDINSRADFFEVHYSISPNPSDLLKKPFGKFDRDLLNY